MYAGLPIRPSVAYCIVGLALLLLITLILCGIITIILTAIIIGNGFCVLAGFKKC